MKNKAARQVGLCPDCRNEEADANRVSEFSSPSAQAGSTVLHAERSRAGRKASGQLIGAYQNCEGKGVLKHEGREIGLYGAAPARRLSEYTPSSPAMGLGRFSWRQVKWSSKRR